MKQNQYPQELKTALTLAKKASEAIIPIYHSSFAVEDKSDGSPVTEADKLSNDIILEGILQQFPDDKIISEEASPIESKSERTWYVDPIDGTKGFIRHTDQFAVHIAFATGNELQIGVVYKPVTGEHYVGIAHEGAYRIGPTGEKSQLQVVPSNKIQIITNNTSQRKSPEKDIIHALTPDKVFTSGGMGLRLVKIAENSATVYLSSFPTCCNTWDLAAPQAIIKEAGAYFTCVDGSPVTYAGQEKLGKEFIVTNGKKLADEVLKVIHSYI